MNYMSKRIVIDPVTRIEGHAKISIFMDDAGNVSDAEFHVVEFRGFEKFCEGRPYTEMPGITQRICGICPGQPHAGVGQGRRRAHGRQHSAGGRQAAPPAEPRPVHPVARAELFPPERAGLSARLGHAAGAAQCFWLDRLEHRTWPAPASACASSARKSLRFSAKRRFIRPGRCPAACAAR